jgi:catechol 2,3-dioxygenase-like lactoylglutathione lyase family enzyme
MTVKTYVPPNVLPPLKQKMGPLLRQKWFRWLVLLPPTITGKRFSNKTEDYGVFQPALVGSIGQVAIYVRDIARSRVWYEQMAGMTHARTTPPEPHPTKLGWLVRACYMNASAHAECLVLLEEISPAGEIGISTGMSFFHFALEVAGNRLEDVLAFTAQAVRAGFAKNYGPVRHNNEPPLGDGETGGNVASYFYDPDFHNVEFCGEMDTIENYRARYKGKLGSER